MQNQFYNQAVVNWAQQNLSPPVEIKLLFSGRWQRLLVYVLLFSVPLLIIAGFIFLKLTGGSGANWFGIFLCSGVLLLPGFAIILGGAFTRQKLVKSLDAGGVHSSMGRKFLWENLHYIDHVSKHARAGGVSRVTEDNQLELVFADGKAIIPPMIKNREQIWNLINSIPVQIKDDGKLRTAQNDAATENLLNALNKG